MSEICNAELAAGVKINFENVAKLNPGLEKHPIFTLAMEQLNELCERLDKELDDA